MKESGIFSFGGRRTVVSAGIVGVLVLAAGWFLDHLTGRAGSGILEDTNQSPTTQLAPEAAKPTPMALPIQVTIQEDRYLVDGQEQSKQQIIDEAQASRAAATPQGQAGQGGQGGQGGPVVKIITGPDSRAGSQSDLQNALDQAQIPWALEAEPAIRP